MNTKSHWESVYGAKAPEAVSWYAAHLRLSLHYVQKAAPAKEAPIIDVGGGESTLVDDLLADDTATSPSSISPRQRLKSPGIGSAPCRARSHGWP